MGSPSNPAEHRSGSGPARAVDIRPTYAEVDASALRHNLAQIQTHVGPDVRVLAVVKADAYGHGAVAASRIFVESGAWGLAVSLVEEGVLLRDASIHAPVVVLGGVLPAAADVIVHRQLRPVVWATEHLELLRAAVRRAGARPVPVHLKIDTGMSRLGTLPENVAAVFEWLRADGGSTIVLEGVMTHLASADDLHDELTSARQLARFRDCLDALRHYGLEPIFRHAANSAGLVRFGESHFNMVRPGIALYGAGSCADVELEGLRLAMAVRSRILGLRNLPAGVRVSYGGLHQLERDSVLAIVPVGYADGYPRSMSGNAQMLVRGHRCRVIGNVTMDTCMLDVTDLRGVRPGEEVTLLGRQGEDQLGIHEFATWSGLVPYEITCGVSKRVPRRYTNT